jgi:hypothetical protein
MESQISKSYSSPCKVQGRAHLYIFGKTRFSLRDWDYGGSLTRALQDSFVFTSYKTQSFLLPQSTSLLSLSSIAEHFTLPLWKTRTMSALTVNCQTVTDNPAIVHLPDPDVCNRVPTVKTTILPTGLFKAHISFQDPMLDLHKNRRGTSQRLSRGSTLSNGCI